ncbi:hypothetical protein ACFS3C_10370 [Azotobacter vinelandii]
MTVESIGNYAEGLARGPERGGEVYLVRWGQAPGACFRCGGAGEGRALVGMGCRAPEWLMAPLRAGFFCFGAVLDGTGGYRPAAEPAAGVDSAPMHEQAEIRSNPRGAC